MGNSQTSTNLGAVVDGQSGAGSHLPKAHLLKSWENLVFEHLRIWHPVLGVPVGDGMLMVPIGPPAFVSGFTTMSRINSALTQ